MTSTPTPEDMTPQNTTRLLLLLVTLLATLACAVSCYLWYVTATSGEVLGCSGSTFDCDAALASQWSKWLGMPVSAFGAACYAGLAFGALLAIAGSATGWRLMEGVVLAAVGAGFWFFLIQSTSLDSYCIYCLMVHACGLVAALLVTWARHACVQLQTATPLTGLMPGVSSGAQPTKDRFAPPPALGVPTLLATAAVASLIVGQATAPPPAPKLVDAAELPEDFSFGGDPGSSPVKTSTAEAEPKHQAPTPGAPIRLQDGERKVSLLGGKFQLNAYRYPIIGSPEAPHIVVELMDYTCPHCRKFHTMLDTAVRALEGEVAIIILPVPAELFCNPYIKKSRPKNRGACRAAKLAMAVAELEPNAFAPLHHWMLEGKYVPAYTTALLRAREVVNKDKLRMLLRDEDGHLTAQIHQNSKLINSLESIARIGLPTQIVGGKVVSGPAESLAKLYELWAEQLGITPPVTARAP